MRELFDMQLPYFERRSCVFIVCSACGNARGLLVVFGLISLFEGEISLGTNVD